MPPPPPRAAAAQLPDFPTLGAVCRGRVSGTMGTGCFIELVGFSQKVQPWESVRLCVRVRARAFVRACVCA